jgi:hypothetical protein
MADAKKKKNIFSRIVGLFKDAAGAIVDFLTDSAIAESIRQDLGLKPGGSIPAATGQKFVQFAAGLDPDKEALSETIAEISDVAQEIKTLAATLETDDFPAGQVSYTLFKLGATDSVRLRWPFLYALSRSILFLEEDTEALIMIDPARLLRQLRGEDLPSGELLAQRITGAGALVLQLLDAFTSKEKNEADTGHVDVFYGWDLSPDSVTPKADLASMRAVTFRVGGASGTGPHLLASLLAVPPEHGGPGIYVSLGGDLTIDKEIERKIDPDADDDTSPTCTGSSSASTPASRAGSTPTSALRDRGYHRTCRRWTRTRSSSLASPAAPPTSPSSASGNLTRLASTSTRPNSASTSGRSGQGSTPPCATPSW